MCSRFGVKLLLCIKSSQRLYRKEKVVSGSSDFALADHKTAIYISHRSVSQPTAKSVEPGTSVPIRYTSSLAPCDPSFDTCELSSRREGKLSALAFLSSLPGDSSAGA